MEVDGKLLEKYYKGHCTTVEREAVEQWLATDTFDDISLELPKDENKEVHKQKMWQQISQVFNPHTIKVIPLYKYAAACTIAFMAALGAIRTDFSEALNKELAIENISEQSKKTNINGLHLELAENSSAKTTSNIFNKTKEVAFCGNMKLKNTSKSKMKLKVHSTCNVIDSKEIVLRSNRNYYAFTLKDKNEDKLYVLNKSEMIRLPKRLALKALSLTKKGLKEAVQR